MRVTPWELLAAARRRWALVAIGALLTYGLLWQTTSVEPVYSAEMRVTLVADVGVTSLRDPQPGLIVAAELVSNRIMTQRGAQITSDSVSLVGEGVRQGFSVTLPNRGSQWVRLVDVPDLRVQAVGSTPAEVMESLRTARVQIDDELVAIQSAVSVAPEARIRASSATPLPAVAEGRGNRARALLASGVLGAALTTALVVVADGRSRQRRRGSPAQALT